MDPRLRTYALELYFHPTDILLQNVIWYKRWIQCDEGFKKFFFRFRLNRIIYSNDFSSVKQKVFQFSFDNFNNNLTAKQGT